MLSLRKLATRQVLSLGVLVVLLLVFLVSLVAVHIAPVKQLSAINVDLAGCLRLQRFGANGTRRSTLDKSEDILHDTSTPC